MEEEEEERRIYNLVNRDGMGWDGMGFDRIGLGCR